MSQLSKFLIFNINNEEYGIPISQINGVIRYVPITPIHESSKFLKGVINLRGKIIPIIDMRAKFSIREKEYTDRTVFIIVDIRNDKGTFNIGIAVDGVQDVVDISSDDLETAPKIGLRLKSQYLSGIAKIGERMIMILNMDKILTSDEVVDMNQLSKEEVMA
jgi:purine-binding chemotaxis protein CheW